VALVTNHCALKDVSSKVSSEALETTIRHAISHCTHLLGKKRPRIAVLGLNPHAGEHGLLGQEEAEVIIPAMKKIASRFSNARLSGPHPADSFFAMEIARRRALRHDMIIAQYHDQGLIPVKLSDFNGSMNMTLGLPIIRTSVDHGTAFDIAGKNKADPGSMIYAIRSALTFLKKRKA
jgi:4-hydroxy-L-threonine phosphate dehydrogenase PdxA